MDLRQDEVYVFFSTVAGIYLKMRKQCEKKLEKFDITYPQFGVLSIVYANPNSIQKEVGELLHTDTTTIMVITDSLEKKKLIQRIPSPDDRRAKMLKITAKGEVVVKKAMPMLLELFQSVLNAGNKKQIHETLQTLSIIAETINQLELKQLESKQL